MSSPLIQMTSSLTLRWWMKAGGGAVAMATLDSFLQTMSSSSSEQPHCLLLLQFPRFKVVLPPPTHSTGLLQGPNSMPRCA